MGLGLSTSERRRTGSRAAGTALGWRRCFRDGDPPRPHAVLAFGTKLVVFADSGGELHVLDATAGTWAAT